MVIGLVLLGLTALMLFLGVAKKVFQNFGVPYLAAFVLVGALIGCAFIPSFSIGSARISVAGFIAPTVFASVLFFLAVRRREAWRALVSMTAVLAVYVAVRLLIDPITSATVTVIVAGFLCGAVAYLTAKTELAALAAVFAALPVGDVISGAVGLFVSETPITLGSAAVFDAVILAAVVSVVLYETVAAIKRTMNARARRSLAEAEASEEFDPNEYKRYFDE